MTRFEADVRTQRAVTYALLVVGEASKHVPDAVRARAPDADWVAATRFRDRVAHGYDSINLTVVWASVTQHLPRLRERVAALVAELDVGRKLAE